MDGKTVKRSRINGADACLCIATVLSVLSIIALVTLIAAIIGVALSSGDEGVIKGLGFGIMLAVVFTITFLMLGFQMSNVARECREIPQIYEQNGYPA